MTDRALIDIGGLATPLVKLIDCIEKYLNVRYEPTYFVKMAKAKSEAAEIAANTKFKTDIIEANTRVTIAIMESITKSEISEIGKRTLKRVLHEEIMKQINIDNIIAQIIDYLHEDARPDEIEDDWFA